jgi:hypothetical protein
MEMGQLVTAISNIDGGDCRQVNRGSIKYAYKKYDFDMAKMRPP